MQVVDSSGTVLYYKTLESGAALEVGQTAYMTFSPIFTDKQITISSVKYYRYFEKQTLPTWMTFLPAKS